MPESLDAFSAWWSDEALRERVEAVTSAALKMYRLAVTERRRARLVTA